MNNDDTVEASDRINRKCGQDITEHTRLNYIGSDVLVFLIYLQCCGDLCSILGPEGIKRDLKEIQRNLKKFKKEKISDEDFKAMLRNVD